MARPADQETLLRRTRERVRGRGLAVPARGPVIGSLASAAYGQIALVLTGVVSARALGPADRGYLALLVLVPAVLQGVGTLGLPRAVTYFIASKPEQEASILLLIRLPIVVQAVTLTALQAVILSVIVAAEPENVQWAALAVLPLLAANVAEAYGKAILQGQQRYLVFNVLRNAGTTFYLVGLLSLLVADRIGLIEFTVAYVVAMLLAGAVTLAAALAGRVSHEEPAEVSQSMLVRFGLKGYVASLSPIATFRLDQVVVGLLLSPKALGLYVVGLAFTNLPGFISRSIGFIAFPKVAGATHGQDDEMRGFFWFSIALSGTAVLVLEITAGWLIPLFFGPEFDGAVTLARILLVSAFLDGARQILTDTSSGSGRPGLGSLAELTSWVVVVPAVVIFLPLFGATGVATATALAAAASCVVLALLLRRSRDGHADPPPSRERT